MTSEKIESVGKGDDMEENIPEFTIADYERYSVLVSGYLQICLALSASFTTQTSNLTIQRSKAFIIDHLGDTKSTSR